MLIFFPKRIKNEQEKCRQASDKKGLTKKKYSANY